MSNISTARDAILNYELKLRPNDRDKTINSNDIKGVGHLDANSNGDVSLRELQNAAKKAKVDISSLSTDEKSQLVRELSTFIKQGGSFSVSERPEVQPIPFVSETPTIEPSSFVFKITPTIDNVKSGSLGSDGNAQVFSKDQSGTAIRKLNKLLENIGFEASGDKFTDRTEGFVKDFQLRNFFTKDLTTGEMIPKAGYENVKLGVVDAKTLEIMEESTKLENPYLSPSPDNVEVKPPVKPTTTNPTQNTNPVTTNGNNQPPVVDPNQTGDPATVTPTNQTGNTTQVGATQTLSPGEVGKFERVRSEVRNQIVEGFKAKGLSPEEAESKANDAMNLGGTLTKEIVRQDKMMNSDNMCYTAVKKSTEQALGITYKAYGGKQGSYARSAPNTFFKDNASQFQKITVPRADVQHLPPGAIVVYSPPNKSLPGHIGVQTIQLKTPQQAASGNAQGLPVTNVHEQDGKIVGLDVRVGKNTVKYTVQDGKVFDDKGKETRLSLDHADISDKQRNDPWASASVDIYFPISSKK